MTVPAPPTNKRTYLQQSRIVVDQEEETDLGILFVADDFSLTLDHERWVDMGKPATLSITIDPHRSSRQDDPGKDWDETSPIETERA